MTPGTYRLSAQTDSNAYALGELTLAPGQRLVTTLRARPLGEGKITVAQLGGADPAASSKETRVFLRAQRSPLRLSGVTSPKEPLTFSGLPADDYTLEASGSPPLHVHLTPGQSADLQLRLWETSVTGTIMLSSSDPAPADMAPVLIRSRGETFEVWADARGRFLFKNVPPGPATLVCRTRFGVARSEFKLEAGQKLEGLRVQLAASARLELEVLRADGSPAVGTPVEVFLADLGLYASAGGGLGSFSYRAHLTSARGRLRLDDLPPGRYVVRATSGTGEVGVLEHLELRAGESPTPAQLRLAAPAALRVFASPATGLELRLGGELLREFESGRLGAQESVKGVLFEGLPGGEVEILLRSQGDQEPARRRIKLTPGSTTEIDLR